MQAGTIRIFILVHLLLLYLSSEIFRSVQIKLCGDIFANCRCWKSDIVVIAFAASSLYSHFFISSVIFFNIHSFNTAESHLCL